ncbi:hypothetical protein VM1G_03277 [Cytospora mali]|uniref:Uncharacterized protein n=1 Tax=Cytospora mali TaxID=578113 RepID=A0A194VW58_CYTMA|nr:hypothetical protein VM1G_03277 [Valsa mali]
MSTFVSKNDQIKVAEVNMAPFKLKAIDDATKSAMQDAIQACYKPDLFNGNDGDNVPVDNDAMDFTFFDGDGNIENASTVDALAAQQPADKPANDEVGEVDSDFSEESDISEEDADVSDVYDEDAEDESVDNSPTRADIGMKSCVRPDGTRYTVGGKGPLNHIDFNAEDADSSEEDNEDETDNSPPTRVSTGMKSCTMPDGTRYTVGGKGPIQHTPSPIEDAESSAEDTGEESDESDDDLGSEEGERQDLVVAVREEVKQKLEQIADLNRQVAAQQNFILKKRLQGRLNGLEDDLRTKLASIEDSNATEMESANEAPQHNTSSGSTIDKHAGNINATNDDKSNDAKKCSSIEADGEQSECWPGEKTYNKKYIKQHLRDASNKTLARITALDAAIEWYTREKYKTLDSSTWVDLQRKIDDLRGGLVKLLQSIGIDENRPQDEAWGWVIRYNEQIRKQWQDCDKDDHIAKHKAMEAIDEMNEKRRLKLEEIHKEDCRVTLLGWVNPKDRKPLPKEAITTVEPSPQHVSDSSAPSYDPDLAMTEAPGARTQVNGNDISDSATELTPEDVNACASKDAVDVDDDTSIFGGDFDFCDESLGIAAPIETNDTSESLLNPVLTSSETLTNNEDAVDALFGIVPASSQNTNNNEEVVEVTMPSLISTEVVAAAEPQPTPNDSNAAPILEEALSTVPTVTVEVDGIQDEDILGSMPTSSVDASADQFPQVAEVVGAEVPRLTEAEKALFVDFLEEAVLEQDVQQHQAPTEQDPMPAPMDNHFNQAAAVPQDVPVIAKQGEPIVIEDIEIASSHGGFKSSAEWNVYPEIPTLEEYLQGIDEETLQKIRADAWAKLHKFLMLEMFHYKQLDVFAFATPEFQEMMLVEYEKCHQEGRQHVLPLWEVLEMSEDLSGREPICVSFSNFVVRMCPPTESQPGETVNEQAQPAAQDVFDPSGSFDFSGSLDTSGTVESSEVNFDEFLNDFADVSGDWNYTPFVTEHTQENIEESMAPIATAHCSQQQNTLGSPAPIICDSPVQAKTSAAASKAAQGKKSVAAAKKTAATKKPATSKKSKGPDLPIQTPVDETTFGQFAQGDVVGSPFTPAQVQSEVGDNDLGDWASAWCQRSWSQEDPEPKNRTPAELARLQQLGVSSNQGIRTAFPNPSPNTSSNLVGAINDHLFQATPPEADANTSTDGLAAGEQQVSVTSAKRSHRGRPSAPVSALRKKRTRELKFPDSPQKVPSGKYARRNTKSPGSSNSDDGMQSQEPDNASEQPTVYYEAAPNRRLGLDTSPEDWVAQSTNKRKRAKPAKSKPRKAQKTQQPTPMSPATSQSSPVSDSGIASKNGPYRAILPRPVPVRGPSNGVQTPVPAADNFEHSHGFPIQRHVATPLMQNERQTSICVSEPMTPDSVSSVQQVAGSDVGPRMGMPPNVPVQGPQRIFQQMPQDNMMAQQNLQHRMSSGMGMGFNGGMQGFATGTQSRFNQPIQQSGMQHAGQGGMEDSDSDRDHDAVMRLLHKTERKMMRKEALRKIEMMEAKMRQDDMDRNAMNQNSMVQNGMNFQITGQNNNGAMHGYMSTNIGMDGGILNGQAVERCGMSGANGIDWTQMGVGGRQTNGRQI